MQTQVNVSVGLHTHVVELLAGPVLSSSTQQP